MTFDFQAHRAHDYLYLARRWKSLARRANLFCESFATSDEYELLCVRSPALETTQGIYLSAGIHGDEPASTEGLYLWAQLNLKYLRRLPLLMLPCLNPWGLIHNRRVDAEGRDLNRSYHLDNVPEITAHKELLKGYSFSFSMCLHEDYDAQGVYLYEVRHRGSSAARQIGLELLTAAGYYVPIDLRKKIEGRKALQGSIKRRIRHKQFPVMPEAAYLAFNHGPHTITFETPSEYELGARVQAQAAAIQRAVEIVLG
jgi:murein peptide amidase A